MKRDGSRVSLWQDGVPPPDQELAQELIETKWKFMSNGKVQIEPKEDLKKRIKRSPDKADNLALTFYPTNPEEVEFDYNQLQNIL
jgi:hypothetical protein